MSGGWLNTPSIAAQPETASPSTATAAPENSGEELLPSGELSAVLGGIKKQFIELRGGMRAGAEVIIPGVAMAEMSTSLTFSAQDGFYYLAAKAGESISYPATAAEALNSGWIRKAGNGNYTWLNLNWNQSYAVYEMNLTDTSQNRKLGEQTTVKGLAGGTLMLDETELLSGQEIVMTFQNPTTREGSWAWQLAPSPAGPWIAVDGTAGDTLTLSDAMIGSYLRCIFTAAGDYEGTVEYSSLRPIAALVTEVTISGIPQIGQKLTASVKPEACEPGIQYEWYRKQPSGSGDTLIYRGKSYEIAEEDIGSQLYVKSVAAAGSAAAGESAVSSLTAVVLTAEWPEVTAVPLITAVTDTTMTMRMPDGSQGLYQFAYSSDMNGEYQEFGTKARDTASVAITGLQPSTHYYIKVRQAAENGYSDSPWPAAWLAEGVTELPSVKGELSLTGETVYGETLTVKAPDISGQTGSFKWYRLSGGTKTDLSLDGENSYEITAAEDVGARIQVDFQGIGSYGGSISIISDVVEKREQSAPTAAFTVEPGDITDQSMSFAVPDIGSGAAVSVGYSVTAGSAITSLSGQYGSGDTVNVTGLKRNTEYYFYFRYVENGTHRQSPWSAALSHAQTTKAILTGSGQIQFSPEVLEQGNRLEAWVESSVADVEGEWSWYQIVNGVKTQIYSFYDSTVHENGTYLIVPENQEPGTRYYAEYTGSGGVEGILSGTSREVVPPATTPYPAPQTPETVSAADTSISFAMPRESEEFYRFQYGETNDPSLAKEISGAVAGNATVLVSSGITRNKDYYVWSKRVPSSEDKTYTESSWCAVPLKLVSDRTSIGGTVGIQGSAVLGQELTAVYTPASYIPEGDDSRGTWQWERNNISISGANSAAYTIQEIDIGKQISVRYYANQDDGFKGNITSESLTPGKKEQTDPGVPTAEPGEAKEDECGLKLTMEAGVYYQIRGNGEAIPKAPADGTEAADNGWSKSITGSEIVNTDYKGEALVPNQSYVVYVVKPGDTQNMPSRVVSSTAALASKFLQTGTISYKTNDKQGMILVGGQITATASTLNNESGSWQWYVSVTDYHTPNPNQWELLSNGFYPLKNSTASTLSVTQEMLGKYIRAEFVADQNGTYTGAADGKTSVDYVKQIYNETISMEGKGYSGQTITIRINQLADQNAVKRVTLNFEGTSGSLTAVKDPADPGRYTCEIPKSGDYYGDTYEGKTIIAQMDTVADKNLYLDSAYQQVKDKLDSRTSTGTELVFKSGIPISSPEDLAALMNLKPQYFVDNYGIKTGTYNGYTSYYYEDSAGTQTKIYFRDGERAYSMIGTESTWEDAAYWGWNGKYIITDNIDMSGTVQELHKGKMRGILDGDFYTVSNLTQPLFYSVYGRSSSYAEIRNIIMRTSSVDYSGVTKNAFAALVSPTGGYAKMSKIMVVDGTLTAKRDVGMLFGYMTTPLIVDQCGTAKGTLRTVDTNLTIGGLGAVMDTRSSMTNCFAVKSKVYPQAGRTGGLLGGANGDNGTFKNLYSANELVDSQNLSYSQGYGGTVGLFSANTSSSLIRSGIYYDKTITPDTRLIDDTANNQPNRRGMGLETNEMLGDKLESAFGSDGTWTYREGFYPRLTWTMEEAVGHSPGAVNIANLYAATTGAFQPLYTASESNLTDLSKGIIHGAVLIPEEFQTAGFSVVSASTNLVVSDGGTISPVGASGSEGTIIITYAERDEDTPVTAEFTFTIDTSETIKALKNVTILSDTVSDVYKEPVRTGSSLTANPIPIAGDNPGSYTYQWYRRTSGTTDMKKITGATGKTYLLTRDDAGCEIAVEVTAAAGSVQYTPILSAFTSAVLMEAPANPPKIISHDYQSVTVEGQGIASGQYEYAYAKGKATENKVVLADRGSRVTVNALLANTTYYFFTRIPAGDSYEASDWSPYATVTTDKINIIGPVTVSIQKNVGDTVTATVPDTNLQTGDWKVERVNGNSVLAVLTGSVSADGYSCQYELQSADVGYQIHFTYTGNGAYQGNAEGSGNIVEKASQLPPTAPSVVSTGDKSITIQMETGAEKYVFGYKGPEHTEIQTVSGEYKAGIPVIITGLQRNTTYEFYAMKQETANYVASVWSIPMQQRTKQSQVTTSIQWVGEPVVDHEIQAKVSGGAQGQTGGWKLERIGSGQTATLSAFSVGADGTLTYLIRPEDTGYQLRAIYTGTGDFTGFMDSKSSVVQAAVYSRPEKPEITAYTDHSVTLKAAGTAGTYQFGYKKTADAGEITAYSAVVQVGSSLTLNSLERGTSYEFYIRRQAEPGYLQSDWSAASVLQTAKTNINGQIRVEGILESGKTLTANYDTGHYPSQPSTDDTLEGTWKWNIGSRVVEGTSCELLAEDGGKTISVIYTAGGALFTGQVEKVLGIVQKTVQAAPPIPLVVTAADTAKGSTLQVTNASDDICYYIQKAEITKLPELVKAEAEDKKGWIQGSADMKLTGLAVNTEYIIYAARLESDTCQASDIMASKVVKTLREELITPLNVADMAPDSHTTVQVSSYGAGPTGTWYWYAMTDKNADPLLIRTQEAVPKTKETEDTFDIPYQYSGYYIQIVFVGNGDYTGRLSYISPQAMEGKALAGTVSVSYATGAAVPRLYESVQASYNGIDELNGSWVWYEKEASEPDSAWKIVDTGGGMMSGPVSSYIPKEGETGRVLKAVYSAVTPWYKGSLEGVTAEIEKAIQNIPDSPQIVSVNGTQVRIADSDPSKAGAFGPHPEAVYGVRQSGETGPVIWNTDGSAMFEHLNPNTAYDFFARYSETSVYQESGESAASPATTGSGIYTAKNLTLSYETEDQTRLDVGRTLTASYHGEGYSQGIWTVKRSAAGDTVVTVKAGETSPPPGCTVSLQPAADGKGGTAELVYTLKQEDVGNRIIVTFSPDPDSSGYTGTADGSTDGPVVKPAAAAPKAPVVEQHSDTDLYLIGVMPGQEYAITESDSTPPSRGSGGWETLDEGMLDEKRRYTYTGLKRNTTYYVHTRVAETDTREVSAAVTSVPVTTLPYFSMGAVTLTNEQDILKQPKTQWEIAMPDTLILNGTLNLESVTLKSDQAGGHEAAVPLEPYESFVRNDGSVSSRVYEAGSRWANDHYGTFLEALDGEGRVLGNSHETPSVLTWSGDAEKLRVSLCRANAVSLGGSYILELLLRDENGTTALLRGEVEITTQLHSVLPVKISLRPVNGRELVQTSNAVSLNNPNGMPVEILLDEKAKKGTDDMPELLGKLETDPSLITEPGAFYMKAAADGSDYRDPDSGIWFNTGLSASNTKALARLGSVSDIEYRISGIGSVTDNAWPWEGTTVEQAYGLTFCCRISEEDQMIYEAEPAEQPQIGGD